MDIGAIWPSNSPWASTVVLVRKKNGKLCFWINLRKLNSLMVKDACSIPQNQDTLDCLQGAVWFTLLDLNSGYQQVELEEASKALTTFMVGPLRFYECEQMPFGLTNAPAKFQFLIDTWLANLQFQWYIIHLDDIIVFAATPKEHLERLWAVFSQLWSAGLKLQPAKYQLFKASVVYLGYIILKEGVWAIGCKVKAIRNWPVPITVTELRSFLGFTNYYRCFIKGYAKVTHHLYDQISGDNAAHKKRKIQWTGKYQEAFNMLKVLCTSAPILASIDCTKPFKLHTNSSAIGWGAVLY